MRLHGIRTTANYYQQILRHEDFQNRQFDTSFVARHPELSRYSDKRHPSDVALAVSAAIAAYAGW
jgi:pyruvate carboxylase subunit A